ncbi:MAG: MBL fold metallo-hydrolase [Pseudomonadales bacterium]|nr:MBL fold metallo-hydrolase [Pseudomonadales bacterium]MCP5213759.1 MBL fold metallo-hydrolase [Pseudomonadales bacterium]
MKKIRYPFSQAPPPGVCLEITPGIKWLRMPLPGSLDHINLYLLEDQDGWFIVDTGLGTAETQQAWQQIFHNELKGKPVKGIIATHMHPDHIGQAGWLTDYWQAPLYMSAGEHQLATKVYQPNSETAVDETLLFYSRFGLDRDTAAARSELWLNLSWPTTALPNKFLTIKNGDELSIGMYHWRVVVGSGHSPEHACLFCEELNLLISGDQILPKITSNVSIYPNDPEANPLEKWLVSLQGFYQIPEQTLVLPAHNLPFTGLHFRAKTIIDHHEEICLSLERACRKPKSGNDLLPVMFKRKLNKFEWALAIGECGAHLNYLSQNERLIRHVSDEGYYLYAHNG